LRRLVYDVVKWRSADFVAEETVTFAADNGSVFSVTFDNDGSALRTTFVLEGFVVVPPSRLPLRGHIFDGVGKRRLSRSATTFRPLSPARERPRHRNHAKIPPMT
jgi:hypothetical protein